MKKNAKIYVAGHAGLVGSAIHRRLETDGYTNLIVIPHKDLDLLRQAEVEAFFKAESPEYVFLAAAKVGGILANSTYPAEFFYSNVMIQANVIHAAYLSGVKKLLFLGSSCIYPRECPQPMKEEYLLSGKLEPTNEPYAIAKIAGIKMCQSYNRQYGTRFISVMPTNLYGPDDNFDPETSHVLPALIRKFHEAKIGGQPASLKTSPCQGRQESGDRIQKSKTRDQRSEIGGRRSEVRDQTVTIWGTGTPRREFLHVDDLAAACIFLMHEYDDSEIVNIGVGKDISIRELAELIKDVVGFKGLIEYDSTKPDGTKRKLLDVSRLTSMGWEPRIGLRQGIEMTYRWYVEEGARHKAQGTWEREEK